MDTWLAIAIDIGVLGLAGLLYYIYQRRRILRFSLYQIEEALDKFHFDVNQYAEENKEKDSYRQINNICEKLDDYFQHKNLKLVLQISDQIGCLSESLQNNYQEISEKIIDHLKVS